MRGEAARAAGCGRGDPAVGECGRGPLAVAGGESVMLCDTSNVADNGEEEIENNSRL